MAVETGLTKMNDVFVPMIEQQLESNAIQMSPYQKMCIMGALQKINELVQAKGINPNSIKTNISSILLTVSSLELNANADPREVYFMTRNHKITGSNGQTITQPEIEMGIEGDGNDALLRRFGRDVLYVHPFWQVKEGDEFEMPKHVGTEITPPTWNESGNGNGKTLYVVYPIDFKAGQDRIDTQYFVTDRESVKRNLMAHCVNNLMWEKKDKAGKIKKLKDFFAKHTIDEILDNEDMIETGNISPAWREPQSRESMIVRKMRNNIVKKIPKQFSNGLMATQFAEHTDDHIDEVRKDVTENANMEVIEGDVEETVAQEAPQPSSTNTAYKEPVAATADTEPSEPDTKEDPF